MADNIAASGGANPGDSGGGGVDAGTPAKTPDTKPQAQLTQRLTPAPGEKAEPKIGKEVASTPEGPRKYKLKTKFEGKEEEREYSEEELSRELQLAKLGHKKASEAAELRKAFTEFAKALKENPIEALKDPAFGVDLKEMVRQELLREYEESLVPPEDKEKLEYKKKAEEYERKVKEYEAQQEAAKQAEYQQRIDTEVRTTFKEAFDVSGLPVTRENMYAMATIMKAKLSKGIELTPEQIAAETNRFLDSGVSRFLGDLDGEALAKRLGDDVVRKLVNYKVAQMRKAAPTPAETPTEPVIAPVKNEDDTGRKKRMSPDERAAYMRSLYIDGGS